jgi:hypothetical protein
VSVRSAKLVPDVAVLADECIESSLRKTVINISGYDHSDLFISKCHELFIVRAKELSRNRGQVEGLRCRSRHKKCSHRLSVLYHHRMQCAWVVKLQGLALDVDLNRRRVTCPSGTVVDELDTVLRWFIPIAHEDTG